MNRKVLLVICITYFCRVSIFVVFWVCTDGGVVNIGRGRFLFGCGFGVWSAVMLKPWSGRLNGF